MKRIEVRDLEFGMFISQLDRPWLESPFLFQGFMIDSEEELGTLQGLCEYVFVDEERSISEDALRRRRQGKSGEIKHQSPNPHPEEFASDFRITLHVQQQLNFGIIKLINDRRLGKMINTEPVRKVVSSLIGNVLRNQNAALWLTKIREEDEFTAVHGINVSILSVAFAKHLGLDPECLEAIGLGALLHDIGLTDKSSEIISKSSKLTAEEFSVVRKHPLDGLYRLKNPDTIPQMTLDILRWHHERLDGTGYPDGLLGEDAIPEHVRIVAMADTYDAMTSDRVYRSAILPSDALAEMYREAENTFGQEFMQSFIQCIGIYPVGSVVKLTTGAIGIVTASTPESRLKPLLLLIRDAEGRELSPYQMVDLTLIEKKTGTPWAIERVIDPTEHGINLNAIAAAEVKMLR